MEGLTETIARHSKFERGNDREGFLRELSERLPW